MITYLHTMVKKTDKQIHDFNRTKAIEYHIIEASFLINNDKISILDRMNE